MFECRTSDVRKANVCGSLRNIWRIVSRKCYALKYIRFNSINALNRTVIQNKLRKTRMLLMRNASRNNDNITAETIYYLFTWFFFCICEMSLFEWYISKIALATGTVADSIDYFHCRSSESRALVRHQNASTAIVTIGIFTFMLTSQFLNSLPLIYIQKKFRHN